MKEQGYLVPEVVEAIDTLSKNCIELDRAVKVLSDAAEKELF